MRPRFKDIEVAHHAFFIAAVRQLPMRAQEAMTPLRLRLNILERVCDLGSGDRTLDRHASRPPQISVSVRAIYCFGVTHILTGIPFIVNAKCKPKCRIVCLLGNPTPIVSGRASPLRRGRLRRPPARAIPMTMELNPPLSFQS